jgi:hypothetical protein
MATTLAISAILVSVIGLGVALWTGSFNRRSADAAEGSQHAADRAADAAKDSARSAAQVARAERDRDHEMYRPYVNGIFTRERSERTGNELIFFAFTPDRSYRMAGHAVDGQSKLPLTVPLLAPAGVPVRFQVDDLGGGKVSSSRELICLQFWPPVADLDPVEPWT